MASCTVGTKLSIMRVIALMAGVASGGGSLVVIVGMAAAARHIHVSTDQFKGIDAVVETSREPTAGAVTISTIRTELPAMVIVLLVAGIAGGGGADVAIVRMTTRAGDGNVPTGQLEGEQIVINTGGRPTRRRMAIGTVGTKLSIMCVIALMAGDAIDGCAAVDVIDMASIAGNCGMLTR